MAATPVTAAAAAKVTPKVTDSVSKKTVNKYQSVKLTAKVIDPKTGKVVKKGVVQLQAYQGGKWKTLKKASIRSNGLSYMWAWPHSTTSYRTLFPNQANYRWAVGNTVKVAVKTPTGPRILAEAKRHTGALYKYGASGPKRFDCSGFTKYVYKKTVGKSLPHKANTQQKYGKAVAKGKKQVGDLIVFRSGSYGYHAGIYAGNGYIYDSPHSGARVGKHKIWSTNYVVRRLAA